MVAAAGMGRYMRMVVGGYMGKVAWMGGGIFALRRPRPTVDIGGHTVARYAVPARVGGRLAPIGRNAIRCCKPTANSL